MGKHVVYVRARDERELEAAGVSVAEWVRELVKEGIEKKVKQIKESPLPELRRNQ